VRVNANAVNGTDVGDDGMDTVACRVVGRAHVKDTEPPRPRSAEEHRGLVREPRECDGRLLTLEAADWDDFLAHLGITNALLRSAALGVPDDDGEISARLVKPSREHVSVRRVPRESVASPQLL